MNIKQRLKEITDKLAWEPCKGMILVDNRVLKHNSEKEKVDLDLSAASESAGISEFLVLIAGADCNYSPGDVVRIKSGSSPVAVKLGDEGYLQFFDHNIAGRATDPHNYQVKIPAPKLGPTNIIAQA